MSDIKIYVNKVTGDYLGTFEGETGADPEGKDIILVDKAPDDAGQKWNNATGAWGPKPIKVEEGRIDAQKLIDVIKAAAPVTTLNLKIDAILKV